MHDNKLQLLEQRCCRSAGADHEGVRDMGKRVRVDVALTGLYQLCKAVVERGEGIRPRCRLFCPVDG